MKALVLRLLPYLGALAIAVAGWAMWRTIDAQGQTLQDQKRSIDQLVRAVHQVADLNRQQANEMESLLKAQQHVSRTLSNRTLEIRRLQDDVEEIRQWAGQPLPADVVRLRARPAVTGAHGYRESMPTGGAVRAERGGSDDQR